MSRRLPSPTGACPEIYPEPSPEIRRGEHRSPAYNIEVYAGGRGRPPLHARPNLTKIPEAGIAHPLFLRFGYHREGQSPSPTPVFRRNRLVKTTVEPCSPLHRATYRQIPNPPVRFLPRHPGQRRANMAPTSFREISGQ